jgi:hypothetical protein
MKKAFLIFIGLFIAATAFCQGENPVQWSFAANKKANKVYDVVITATFSKPWHLYSQSTPEGGPTATKISFKANPVITLDGKIKETGDLKTVRDENVGVDVKYYFDKVVFTQTVKLKADVKTHATGTMEYLVCNDTRCLPPKKVPFDITLQ